MWFNIYNLLSFSYPHTHTVNRYGYFRSDYKQAQDVVYRFIKIYDSLGIVMKCVSE